MIVYWDTSALVPLLIVEPATPGCLGLWDAADRHVTSRLAYVEAAAAIAMAERLGRLRPSETAAALADLDALWPQIDLIELDDRLTREAARAARTYGLRGYDAVHYAAACALAGDRLVAASGDAALLAAWHASGIATFDSTSVVRPPLA